MSWVLWQYQEDPRAVMLLRKSVFVFVGNLLNILCGLLGECEHHLLPCKHMRPLLRNLEKGLGCVVIAHVSEGCF